MQTGSKTAATPFGPGSRPLRSVEVARHARATPGSLQICDDHFGGPSIKQPGQYRVRARNQAEEEFLAICDGARVWLHEACAAGTQKIRAKMGAAVTMAKAAGP